MLGSLIAGCYWYHFRNVFFQIINITTLYYLLYFELNIPYFLILTYGFLILHLRMLEQQVSNLFSPAHCGVDCNEMQDNNKYLLKQAK